MYAFITDEFLCTITSENSKFIFSGEISVAVVKMMIFNYDFWVSFRLSSSLYVNNCSIFDIYHLCKVETSIIAPRNCDHDVYAYAEWNVKYMILIKIHNIKSWGFEIHKV